MNSMKKLLILLATLGLLAGAGVAISITSPAGSPAQHIVTGTFPPPVGG